MLQTLDKCCAGYHLLNVNIDYNGCHFACAIPPVKCLLDDLVFALLTEVLTHVN
jgi:hypothetical protein